MSNSKYAQPRAFQFCSEIQQLLPCSANSDGSCCKLDECYRAGEQGIICEIIHDTDRQRVVDDGQSVQFFDQPVKFFDESVQFFANYGATGASNGQLHAAWCPDSGASITACNNFKMFESITDWKPIQKVRTANQEYVPVMAIGTIRLKLTNASGISEYFLLENVCYIPSFAHNLLSIKQLARDHDIKTVFGRRSYFRTPSRNRFYIHEEGNSYAFEANYTALDKHEIYHKKFMHAGKDAIKRLSGLVPELRDYVHDRIKCSACQKGGAKAKPFRKREKTVYTYFGQRISSDLCGPFPVSIDGYTYAVLFHDRCTKHFAVYFVKDKTKESVMQAFRDFLKEHEDILPHGVTEFHTDNGSEYVNSDMEKFCEELCITRTYTVPFSPQLNPYSERTWGSLLRKVRTALVDSNVPHVFWTYCMSQAAMVCSALLGEKGKSTYEMAWGKPFDYKTLHVWGCKVYYLVPEHERPSKLAPRALEAVYLGPDPKRNGHVVWIPQLRKITTAYHVVFSEDEYYDFDTVPKNRIPKSVRFQFGTGVYKEPRDLPQGKDPNCEACQGKHRAHTCGRGKSGLSTGHLPVNGRALPTGSSAPLPPDTTAADADSNDEHFEYERCDNPACEFHSGHTGPCSDQYVSSRTRGAHARGGVNHDAGEYVRIVLDNFCFDVLKADLAIGEIKIPKSYDEALASLQRSEWEAAMSKELSGITANETWDVVSRGTLPRGRKPAASKWVYTLKYNRDGSISRYKARFVVCGYSQIKGLDYEHAFSATLRATSFRTLLAIASGLKLKLGHIDVSNAFTQANLDDVDIWIEAPKGMPIGSDEFGKQILKLKRALYGAKQSSRLWQQTLTRYLIELGFVQSKADSCIFHYDKRQNGTGLGQLIIGVYVDDLIIAHDGKYFDWFCKKFQQRFNTTEPVKLDWFLGIGVDQHDDYSVTLCQRSYIEKMVEKFLQSPIPECKTPNPEDYASLGKAANDDERLAMESLPYLSLIGSLLFAAVMTRPDIAYHTSVLAKFMSDPSPTCYKVAIDLLVYLHHTKDKKMMFPGTNAVPDGLQRTSCASSITKNFGFVAYSDSSWGNKYPYPMFGYCIYLFGGLISFTSKQMKIVALSSCEAEYVAATACCKEIKFVRNICAEMGLQFNGPLVLCVDNTAAIDVAHNNGVSGRTKHFDMSIHYFRDQVWLHCPSSCLHASAAC